MLRLMIPDSSLKNATFEVSISNGFISLMYGVLVARVNSGSFLS